MKGDPLLFEGHGSGQNGSFYQDVLRPDPPPGGFLHSVVTECIACPRQALGPCQSSIVSEPSPASTFIFQRWTRTPSPQSLQLYRRKEDKGGGGGEGGQCLSGILVFAFNLESSCLGNKTFLKISFLHASSNLQMAGHASVWKGSLLRLKKASL